MTIRNQNFKEKRSSRRYEARDSSAVILTPGNIVSFCVLDVSISGMSFCYNGFVDDTKTEEKASMTFFGEEVGALDLSVQIISDSDFNEKYIWKWAKKYGSIMPDLRRCGVKFDALSEKQGQIIQNYIHSLAEKAEKNGGADLDS